MRFPSILAFDASGRALTAAFSGTGGRVKSAETELEGSNALFRALKAFLKRGRVRLSGADAIAVGLGPGSFTGLRVAVTCAKTLAYALDAKLIGISTLRVIAENAPAAPGPLCVAMDARRGNVYAATYAAGRTVSAPRLWAAAEFLAGVRAGTRYIGSALAPYGGEMARAAGRSALLADARLWRPSAERMLDLALERWRERRFDEPLALAPEYLYGNECMVTRPVTHRVVKNAKNQAA